MWPRNFCQCLFPDERLEEDDTAIHYASIVRDACRDFTLVCAHGHARWKAPWVTSYLQGGAMTSFVHVHVSSTSCIVRDQRVTIGFLCQYSCMWVHMCACRYTGRFVFIASYFNSNFNSNVNPNLIKIYRKNRLKILLW